MPNGTYRVVARHSGKALDVFGHQTQDGADVIQWAYGGGNNQRWTLTHLGSNVYQIMGVESGKALAVASTSTANGTNVDIRTYTGAAQPALDHQRHQRRLLPPLAGEQSAIPHSTSTAHRPPMAPMCIQWSWTGGNNQQWIFQAP